MSGGRMKNHWQHRETRCDIVSRKLDEVVTVSGFVGRISGIAMLDTREDDLECSMQKPPTIPNGAIPCSFIDLILV